ncbi:MAG: hypothetical protein RLZZ347_618 [Candidatus Parcubacteria bacterium]
MSKNIIQRVPLVNPPKGLQTRITARIRELEVRSIRIHLIAQSIGAIASLALLIPAYQFASTEWTQSEFGSYLSLILSDGSLALTYWKELLLSLGESAPLLSISALASTLVIGMSTLKASSHYLFSLQKIRTA